MTASKILAVANWIYFLLAVALGTFACVSIFNSWQTLILHPKFKAGQESLDRVFATGKQKAQHATQQLNKYGLQLEFSSPRQAAAVFGLQSTEESSAARQITLSAIDYLQNANLDDAERSEVIKILVLGSHSVRKGASLQTLKLIEQLARPADADALRELRPSQEALEAWGTLLAKFQLHPSAQALKRINSPPDGFGHLEAGTLGNWLVKYGHAANPEVKKFAAQNSPYLSPQDLQALSATMGPSEIEGMRVAQILRDTVDGKPANLRAILPADISEDLKQQIAGLIVQVLQGNGQRPEIQRLMLPYILRLNKDELWEQLEKFASSSPSSFSEVAHAFETEPSERLLDVLEACVLKANDVSPLQSIEQLARREQLESQFHIRQRFGLAPPSAPPDKLEDSALDPLINKIRQKTIKLSEITQLSVATLSADQQVRLSSTAWSYLEPRLNGSLDIRARYLADVYCNTATAANQTQLLALLTTRTLPIESRHKILTKLIALKSTRLDEFVRMTDREKNELIAKNWSVLEPIVCRVMLEKPSQELDSVLFSLCSIHGGQLTVNMLRVLRNHPDIDEHQSTVLDGVAGNLEKKLK